MNKMDSKSLISITVINTLLILLFCTQSLSASGKDETRTTQIKKHRLKLDGSPVEVKMRAVILDIDEVNCLNMELTVELYLQHFWRDPTYIDNESIAEQVGSKPEDMKGIWIPDSYIVNARKSEVRKQDIIPSENGNVERSEIITVTTKCPMEFSLYPFDHQKCTIELESYTFTIEDLLYFWSDEVQEGKAVDIAPTAESVLPFQVMNVESRTINITYMNETYSRVIIDIYLRRYWNTYLETFYVPMTFFLSLSLLSLWLVYPKISAMVNFFNVSLVNIFLQLYQSNSDLPKLYYKTALTAYSIICYVFIFLTLFLNVYILFYIKTDEDDNGNNDNGKKENRRDQDNSPNPETAVRNIQSYIVKTDQISRCNPTPSPIEPSNWLIIKGHIMDKLRRNSHWALLCTFLLTKFIYWVTLISIHYSTSSSS